MEKLTVALQKYHTRRKCQEKTKEKKVINFKAVFRRSDEQNKTDDQTISDFLNRLSDGRFWGWFFYMCNKSDAIKAVRSMMIRNVIRNLIRNVISNVIKDDQ